MSQMTITTPNSGTAYSIANDLIERGLAVPDITRIVFNTSTGKSVTVVDENGKLVVDPNTGKPLRKFIPKKTVLATTVFFADGTKTTVKNSENESVTDSSGNVTDNAKERGIIYALARRVLCGKFDKDTGELKQEGFGRILSGLVKNAHDQQAELKKRAEAKAAAKKRHEDSLKAAAKSKCKSPSPEQCIMDLLEGIKPIIDDLVEKKQR